MPAVSTQEMSERAEGRVQDEDGSEIAEGAIQDGDISELSEEAEEAEKTSHEDAEVIVAVELGADVLGETSSSSSGRAESGSKLTNFNGTAS